MLTLGIVEPLLVFAPLRPVMVNEVKKGGVWDVDRKHPAPATRSPLYGALWERPAVHWGATASSRAEWTQMGRVPVQQSKQTFTLAHRHAHKHDSCFTLGVQGKRNHSGCSPEFAPSVLNAIFIVQGWGETCSADESYLKHAPHLNLRFPSSLWYPDGAPRLW